MKKMFIYFMLFVGLLVNSYAATQGKDKFYTIGCYGKREALEKLAPKPIKNTDLKIRKKYFQTYVDECQYGSYKSAITDTGYSLIVGKMVDANAYKAKNLVIYEFLEKLLTNNTRIEKYNREYIEESIKKLIEEMGIPRDELRIIDNLYTDGKINSKERMKRIEMIKHQLKKLNEEKSLKNTELLKKRFLEPFNICEKNKINHIYNTFASKNPDDFKLMKAKKVKESLLNSCKYLEEANIPNFKMDSDRALELLKKEFLAVYKAERAVDMYHSWGGYTFNVNGYVALAGFKQTINATLEVNNFPRQVNLSAANVQAKSARFSADSDIANLFYSANHRLKLYHIAKFEKYFNVQITRDYNNRYIGFDEVKYAIKQALKKDPKAIKFLIALENNQLDKLFFKGNEFYNTGTNNTMGIDNNIYSLITSSNLSTDRFIKNTYIEDLAGLEKRMENDYEILRKEVEYAVNYMNASVVVKKKIGLSKKVPYNFYKTVKSEIESFSYDKSFLQDSANEFLKFFKVEDEIYNKKLFNSI